MLADSGFEAENISSILAGSGRNIGTAIDELIANKSKLEELKQPVRLLGQYHTS